MVEAGKRVAVIGSGISGLSAAWLLNRDGFDVTLFEKEAQFGGHTLTDTTSPYPVDLGFQVYNLTTYPHMVGFLDALGVDTEPSDMSFALSMDDGSLEWGSDGLDALFAQRGNIVNPSFLAMVRDVIRFGKEAPKVLEPANMHVYRTMTLGEYLSKHSYSQGFTKNYVVPMCAAVWSVPNAQVLQFPVQMLIRFWVNHHLLDILQRPLWRVVKGRSREYVRKVIAGLPDARAVTAVTSVRRPAAGQKGPIVVTTATGEHIEYDAVVFATHSDITMRILGEDADEAEKAVLQAIPYNENDVYLHTDASLMPVNRKVWASWNLIGKSTASDNSAVCVSYWVNRLQHLPSGAPDMFVTLNPLKPPAEDTVIRRLSLAHPVFSFASVEAQAKVAQLQGNRGTYYAGAWCGYGFHEDGIKSAVEAVKVMGVTIPWVPRSVSPKMSLSDQLFLNLFDKFARATITTGYLRIILPNGYEKVYGDPAKTAAPVPAGEEWRGRPSLGATMRVFNFDVFRKIVTRHDTGLGEAYMAKDFEVNDLGALLAVITANVENSEVHRGSTLGVLNWLGDRLLNMAHLSRSNTIEGSRKNIEEHYDAGNAMYRLFLDETMTYSSGVHHKGESLYQAQLNKLDMIIARAGIKKGDKVLEIGCGWGSFAIRAAQTTGCSVVGLTLSKEQLAEATQRVQAAGLEGQVDLMFCDYRDCPGAGTFDKVVSIEMIEAVGHEHLATYFATIGRMLKPGGRAVIQAISVPDERYEAYCKCGDFIREHIFPGGHLPCIGAMVEACRGTGLTLHDTHDIGPDYAITLREWRARWDEHKADILALGYSERFWLKYRFYFAYCEAGFDARYIHNFHVTWVKDQQPAALTNGTAPHSTMPQPGGIWTVAPGSMAAAAAAAGSRALGEEMPSDPITQALLAVYFFLAGMIIKSHRFMWLLPSVWCACALANAVLHPASNALLPFYRFLTFEQRAWWCADLLHLIYSAGIALASITYLLREPGALRLGAQSSLSELHTPTIIVCTATGFCAFHLWLCVRYRLFNRTTHAMLQYTLLLVLFGVAAYKSVNLPFLAACLSSEAASVPFLLGKLQNLAGFEPSSRARMMTQYAELATLAVCRVLPHAVITLIVLLTPSAFGSMALYLPAVLGLAYLNHLNIHKAKLAYKSYTQMTSGRAGNATPPHAHAAAYITPSAVKAHTE